MGRLPAHWLLGLALCAGPAAAQDKDVVPSGEREGVVHVNAMKDPEMHSYRAIVAGLDTFDDLHGLAPSVPKLLFAARRRGGAPLTGPLPSAKLSADDFTLDLPVNEAALFEVPRSRQAWDARAELIMGGKRNAVRVWPHVRTPGLADNQRRLGDLRLECRVLVAVAKEEVPFYITALVNTVLLTRDWCGFLKDQDRTWSASAEAELASATLHEGERRQALKVEGKHFMVPLSDAGWSNDALIDLAFTREAEPIRTADETPQTAP
jgi:hypothetical protein